MMAYAAPRVFIELRGARGYGCLSSMVKPSDFFDAFERAAVAEPEAATIPDAVFRFELSGDDGGRWTLDLRKGTTSGVVTHEEGPEEDARIHVTADDWVALTTGRMNPMRAFMGGKVRVDGDLKLAVNLPNVVNMVEGYGITVENPVSVALGRARRAASALLGGVAGGVGCAEQLGDIRHGRRDGHHPDAGSKLEDLVVPGETEAFQYQLQD